MKRLLSQYPFTPFLKFNGEIMDYGKIKSPEKFRIEIIKAKKIKSFELQISRLKLIQQSIYDLIKAKRKVRLLSTEGEKRLLAEYEEIYKETKIEYENKKKKLRLLKNIIDKKIKPENLRVKTDYIEWLGTKEELVKLINALIEKGYIVDMPKSKIRTAIKHHFCIGEFLDVVKEKVPKIKWGKTKPLLVHLFVILYNNGYFNNEYYNSRFTYISKHFVSKEGKNFTNKKLREEYDKGTQTQGASYSGAPIGHDQLEDLIKKTLASD